MKKITIIFIALLIISSMNICYAANRNLRGITEKDVPGPILRKSLNALYRCRDERKKILTFIATVGC